MLRRYSQRLTTQKTTRITATAASTSTNATKANGTGPLPSFPPPVAEGCLV